MCDLSSSELVDAVRRRWTCMWLESIRTGGQSEEKVDMCMAGVHQNWGSTGKGKGVAST